MTFPELPMEADIAEKRKYTEVTFEFAMIVNKLF